MRPSPILLLPFICIMCTIAVSQTHPMYVYDLSAHLLIDSLFHPNYDSVILSDRTEHFPGFFNQSFAPLDDQQPTSNLYPNSEFTRKRQASLDYELTDFPIRTSIRFTQETDSGSQSHCSGSMVSRRHVLTAAHCLMSTVGDTLFDLTMDACPVFDNGLPSADFPCARAIKAYFYKNWEDGWRDIAIVELDEPIGDRTGWLGIGFNNVDSALSDELFYKFTYPGTFLPQLDSNAYNGDTLYYGYGKGHITPLGNLGALNASGIPGESGSSMIAVKNQEYYTSYGALTFSSNLQHRRFDNEMFYAFKEVLKDDLVSMGDALPSTQSLSPYPTPSSGIIYFQNPPEKSFDRVKITNHLGQTVATLQNFDPHQRLDISRLSNGMYFLTFEGTSGSETHKIIKSAP